VRAFESVRPADGLRFTVRSQIPLSGGLGSSAAAIVAGLLAAGASEPLAAATQLEGHPDNVAAALRGGFVICAAGEAHRLDPPPGLRAVLAVPDEGVTTQAARERLPRTVPLADAVFNTARGALLFAGIATGDRELIARGLADRLHQPYRAELYPRSAALLERAHELGALGATISGAGPTVMFWTAAPDAPALRARLEPALAGWARAIETGFAASGATLA